MLPVENANQPDEIDATIGGQPMVLHEFSGYVCEWGHRYPTGKFANQWNYDEQFTFLPGCFDACLARQPDIALTKDLDGKSVFARTGDGTLTLTSDDTGLLARVTLLDSPLNRQLCFMIGAKQIRGWSHRAQPLFGGFRLRDENGVTLTEHRHANLTEVTLVVRKFPRARERKTPIFLSGGPQAKGIDNA